MQSTRDEIKKLYRLLENFNAKHETFTKQVKTYREKHAVSVSDQIFNTVSSIILPKTTTSAPTSRTPLLRAGKEKEKEKEKETTAKLDRWLTTNTIEALTKAAHTCKQFTTTLSEERASRDQVKSILNTCSEEIKNAFKKDMASCKSNIMKAEHTASTMIQHMEHLISLYPTLTTYANKLSEIVADARNKTELFANKVAAFQAKNSVILSFQQFADHLPEIALDALPINSLPYPEYYLTGEKYFAHIPFEQMDSLHPENIDSFQPQMKKITADAANTLSLLEKKLTCLNDEHNSIDWNEKFVAVSNIQTANNQSLDFIAFNQELIELVKLLLKNKKGKPLTLAELTTTFDTMLEKLSQLATLTETTIHSLDILMTEMPTQLTADEFIEQELINDINELFEIYRKRINALNNARQIMADNSTQCVMSLIDRFEKLISKKTFNEICNEFEKSNGLSWEMISAPAPLGYMAEFRTARKELLKTAINFIKKTRTNFFNMLEENQQINQEAKTLQNEIQIFSALTSANDLMLNHHPDKLNIKYEPATIGEILEQEISSVVKGIDYCKTKWLSSEDFSNRIKNAVTRHYKAQERYEALQEITSMILNQLRPLKNYLPVISTNDSAEYAQIVTLFNELIELSDNIFAATKASIDNGTLKKFLQNARDKTTTKITACTQPLLSEFQEKLDNLRPAVTKIKDYEATVETLNSTPTGSNIEQNNVSVYELFGHIKEDVYRLNEIKESVTKTSQTLDNYCQPTTKPLANVQASLDDIKTQWLNRALLAFEKEYEAFETRENSERLQVEMCERWAPAFKPNFARLEELHNQIYCINSLKDKINLAKDNNNKMALQLSTELDEKLAQEKNKLTTIQQFQHIFRNMKNDVLERLNQLDSKNLISRKNTRWYMSNLLTKDSKNGRMIAKLTQIQPFISPRVRQEILADFKQIIKAGDLFILAIDNLYPTGLPTFNYDKNGISLTIRSAAQIEYKAFIKHDPTSTFSDYKCIFDNISSARTNVAQILTQFECNNFGKSHHKDTLQNKIKTILETFPEIIFTRLKPFNENQRQTILALDNLKESRKKDIQTFTQHNQNLQKLNALISSCLSSALIPAVNLLAVSDSHSINATEYSPLPFDASRLTKAYQLRISQLNAFNNISSLPAYDFSTFMQTLKDQLQQNKDTTSLLNTCETWHSQNINSIKDLLQQITATNADKIPSSTSYKQLQSEYSEKLSSLKAKREALKKGYAEKINKLQSWIALTISQNSFISLQATVDLNNPLEILKATPAFLEKILNDYKEAQALSQLKYVATSDPVKIASLSESIKALSKQLRDTAFQLRDAFIQHLEDCDKQVNNVRLQFHSDIFNSLDYTRNSLTTIKTYGLKRIHQPTLLSAIKNLMLQIDRIDESTSSYALNFKNVIKQELANDISTYWAQQEARLWDYYFSEMQKIEILFQWLINIDAEVNALQKPIEVNKTTYDKAFEQLAFWDQNVATPFLKEYQHLHDEKKKIKNLDRTIRQLSADKKELNEIIELQNECTTLDEQTDALCLSLNKQKETADGQLKTIKILKQHIDQRATDIAELTTTQHSFETEKQALHDSHVLASVKGVVFKRLHYVLMNHDDVKKILALLEGRAANHAANPKKVANMMAIRGFITAFTTCNTNLSDLMQMIDNSLTTNSLSFANNTASLLSTAKKPTVTCQLLQRLQVTVNNLINTWEDITLIKDLESDFIERNRHFSDLSFLDNPPANTKPAPRFLFSYHYEALKNNLAALKTKRDKTVDDLKIKLGNLGNNDAKDDMTKLQEFRQIISDTYNEIIKTLGPTYNLFGKGSNLANELKKSIEVLNLVLADQPKNGYNSS